MFLLGIELLLFGIFVNTLPSKKPNVKVLQ